MASESAGEHFLDLNRQAIARLCGENFLLTKADEALGWLTKVVRGLRLVGVLERSDALSDDARRVRLETPTGDVCTEGGVPGFVLGNAGKMLTAFGALRCVGASS